MVEKIHARFQNRDIERGFNEAFEDYAKKHFCPQCDAEEFVKSASISGPNSDFERGWLMASIDVALQPHNCGAWRYMEFVEREQLT